MLVGNNLRKNYGPVVALDNVSISIESGAAIAVLGPSGGGKSTLVRNLSLIEPPDSGSISLDDQNIDYGLWPWPKGVGSPWPAVTVVFQQLYLWPDKTLAKNVQMPALLRGESIVDFESLADRLGILDLMDRYPNEVSVGQIQRAALMRALMLKPKYLLLDEITAALDVEQIHAVGEVLVDYLEMGTGMLVVTHHLGFAEMLTRDKPNSGMAFLEAGRIFNIGGIESLEDIANERVQTFFSAMRAVR